MYFTLTAPSTHSFLPASSLYSKQEAPRLAVYILQQPSLHQHNRNIIIQRPPPKHNHGIPQSLRPSPHRLPRDPLHVLRLVAHHRQPKQLPHLRPHATQAPLPHPHPALDPLGPRLHPPLCGLRRLHGLLHQVAQKVLHCRRAV